MNVRHVLALASFVIAAAASAQPIANITMPAPERKAAVPTGPGSVAVLRAGTAVALKAPEAFQGKKAAVGQRVQLTVASEVLAGSKVAIPAGAWAEGQVTEVRDGGVAGKLAVKMLTVRGSKGPLKLTASFNSGGVKAFLDEDLKVAQ